eukprot:jgi/Botrbrau1/11325/Bobra.0038s0085.1
MGTQGNLGQLQQVCEEADGHGKETLANRNKYAGKRKEGKRHGHGKETLAKEWKYVGQWKQDHKGWLGQVQVGPVGDPTTSLVFKWRPKHVLGCLWPPKPRSWLNCSRVLVKIALVILYGYMMMYLVRLVWNIHAYMFYMVGYGIWFLVRGAWM